MTPADLPSRWHRRERFVVLESGFGQGGSFLDAWWAWRTDPNRCRHLDFIALEPHPPERSQLARRDDAPGPASIADRLARAWPPLTRDLHCLRFDGGRVRLLLWNGAWEGAMAQLVATVDWFRLDMRHVAPRSLAAHRDTHLGKRLARLAAPSAAVTLAGAGPTLRDGLASAGFELGPGAATAPEGATLEARYAPRHGVRRPPSRHEAAGRGDEHAVIVGAGLAGCAVAWALAEMGWRSTVLDRSSQVASGASGNVAGLFHGTVNEPDGPHSRFNRVASFAAHDAVRIAIERHGVPGGTAGMLRLERSLTLAEMRSRLARLQLPADYLQALDCDQASAVAGTGLQAPAWFFAGGGWVQPAGLARSFIERAGSSVRLQLGTEVHAALPHASGWRLLDPAGRTLVDTDTLVLANAADAFRLLGAAGAWPIETVRGQISTLRAGLAPFDLPRVPISGAGYLLPEIAGLAVFGATAQAADADPQVRIVDHRENVAQLERLLGRALAVDAGALQGRTAWRCTAADRLPLIGAAPDAALARSAHRLDQPRFVPRAPGLFMFTGLGSRGITWSALGAQVLAAQIAGAPLPVIADLQTAIDPARFISRRSRRLG